MKKLGLLAIPVLAVPFLTNCGNNSPEPQPTERTLTLSLTNCLVDGKTTYSRAYREGETIEDVTVTPIKNCNLISNSVSSYFTAYWKAAEGGAYVLSGLVMDNDYEIKIEAFNQYHITIGTVDHLSFTTVDGKPLDNVTLLKKQSFTFKMKSTNEPPSSYEYIAPTMIDIVVDGMDPLLEGYHVTINPKDETEAEVTIDGDKVIGNIALSGEAAIKGGYRYKAPYLYGLKTIAPGIHENDDGDLSLTFEAASKDSNETYTIPQKENIYIQFDNVTEENPIQWVSPAETFSTIDEYCAYDEATGVLTIKSGHIKSNIIIVAKAHDYPLLDKLSWEEINKVSFSGVAKYVFDIGETKEVKLKNQTFSHTVRIIDFNHDTLASDESRTAGITFEFANVISNENKIGYTQQWEASGSSENFPKSTLNNFLNDETEGADSVINNFPPELRGVIKSVNKKVGKGGSKDKKALHTYKAKLFPLAYCEMIIGTEPAANEGSMYAYYDDTLSYYKAKYDLSGTKRQYWLRSPNVSHNSQALIINDSALNVNRGIITGASSDGLYCFAPAFCI